ncbi:hypothetical protein MPTK1_1g26950 [Marchantia polymorpha subsp. ruderalis]|uniref:Uncharacterized protein n=2 Tax=Marchantia polymorpha TaxID=3197 RepID=A0AAF6AUP9_MARPO|nr:hypothetical protein MARPO_0002s0183 [Marchantia polymorpha]BBN00170.1 hypothetical protein Mp_1g26950 [Marchantia polymorpha subsp. ruderalis]|eukprot:PTQ49714.1 hypothetical protein MARPO_0002s0183 [Marchantia polymorpha]
MTSFDPHHWKCTPEYIPPIHPPARNVRNKYEGRTNTSTKTVKVAQSFYGILFPHPLTGYKMPGASGQSPAFDDLTTNQYFQGQVRKVGEEVGQGDKKLIPYHPDATRNRPRAESCTDVGLANFDRRNASYIKLKHGRASKSTPKTTNQLFMGPPPKETPGLWHSGICRDRAIWLHRKQQGMAGN